MLTETLAPVDLLWRDLYTPSCTLCPLHEHANYVCMLGDGPVPSDYMLIGEAPGQHEDEVSHKPFTGRAGRLLDDVLKEVGLSRSMFWVGNGVLCRPESNRDPTPTELKTCWSNYGLRIIERVQPKFVVLMGRFALQAVMGKQASITRLRGHEFVKDSITFLPTFHTAHALYNPGMRRWIVEDLLYFKRLVGLEATAPDTRPIVISDRAALEALVARLLKSESVAIDTETQGLDVLAPDKRVWCMSLSDEDGIGYVVPLEHPDYDTPWAFEVLKPLLEDRRVKKIFQNGKFDAKALMRRGIATYIHFDTLQAAHLLDENRKHNLKSLAQSYLGVRYWGSGEDYSVARPMNELAPYAAKDADYDRQLYRKQRAELLTDKRLTRVFQYITMPAVRALTRIEYHGLPVDMARLRERKAELEMRMAAEELELERLLGKKINWRSPQQIAQALYGSPDAEEIIERGLGLPILAVTEKGNPSTAREAILDLRERSPVIETLLRYRRWQKWHSTYLEPWSRLASDEHPFLHTTYNIEGTVTGRLSSSDPINLQNIPRDGYIKGVIGGVPGWKIVEADFSQIELRIAALLSGDLVLLNAYRTGQDVHRLTASRLLGLSVEDISDFHRTLAKAVNFGLLYGMGYAKLQWYAKTKYEIVFTLDEAQSFREQYFDLYQALPLWHERQRRRVHRDGFVRSPLGRVRRLPEVLSDNWEVIAEAERQAVNSPVQATASDFTLLAMNLLAGEIEHELTTGYPALQESRAKIVGTVHDSILFLVREDSLDVVLPAIQQTMEHLPLQRLFGWEPSIPIAADLKVSAHWSDGD